MKAPFSEWPYPSLTPSLPYSIVPWECARVYLRFICRSVAAVDKDGSVLLFIHSFPAHKEGRRAGGQDRLEVVTSPILPRQLQESYRWGALSAADKYPSRSLHPSLSSVNVCPAPPRRAPLISRRTPLGFGRNLKVEMKDAFGTEMRMNAVSAATRAFRAPRTDAQEAGVVICLRNFTRLYQQIEMGP